MNVLLQIRNILVLDKSRKVDVPLNLSNFLSLSDIW